MNVWSGKTAYDRDIEMHPVSAHDRTLRRAFFECLCPHRWDPEKLDKILGFDGMKGFLLRDTTKYDFERCSTRYRAHQYWESNGRNLWRQDEDVALAIEEQRAGAAIGGMLIQESKQVPFPRLHGMVVHPDFNYGMSKELPNVMLSAYRQKTRKVVDTCVPLLLDERIFNDMSLRYYNTH